MGYMKQCIILITLGGLSYKTKTCPWIDAQKVIISYIIRTADNLFSTFFVWSTKMAAMTSSENDLFNQWLATGLYWPSGIARVFSFIFGGFYEETVS